MILPSNRSPARWPEGVISRAEGRQGMVALTFDDGPNVPATARVREVLNSHGVRGTFFVVGKALEVEAGPCRELLRDGHVIANHSYSHSMSAWLSPTGSEITDGQQAIAKCLGVLPAYFRPAYGLLSRTMLGQLHANRLTCVTWDVAVEDWSLDNAAEIARRVLDAVLPGSIVLLHDGHDGDVTADRSVLVDALPAILDGLRERALTPVGLDNLLERGAYLA